MHAFTTEGVSYTNDIPGAKRDSLYTSGSFKSSMPYAIPVASQGEFYHIGSLADGKARSHTCRRQAAYVAMILWDVIGDRKVKNVTYNLYDDDQKTCSHFPKETREKGLAAREAKKKKKETSTTTASTGA